MGSLGHALLASQKTLHDVPEEIVHVDILIFMCMIISEYVHVMCNHLCVNGGREREREKSRKCAEVKY